VKKFGFLVLIGAMFGVASAQELTPPPAQQLAPGASPSTLLPGLIEHSRSTARIENGRLVGEGATFLRELGANAHFMLMGETHGTAEIAEFATAYWRDLNEAGYNYGVLEADPWVVGALERELRAGGMGAWASFLPEHGGDAGAAFFNMREEVEWAAEMVRTSRARRQPVLWGIDQVFIGSAPWILRDIAENARNADARALAARLSEASAVTIGGSGRSGFAAIPAQDLADLRAMLNGRRDARWAEAVDAMILSHRIYQPFTGGGGEALLANDERELLMKRLFAAHYEAATEAEREPPRAMFKFGATHMYRGPSMTQVQGLGGFVTEYATARGLRAASVLVVCAPGGQANRFRSPPGSCDGDFNAFGLGALSEYISPDELTVFDLRVWRLRYRRWEHLPASIQRAVSSFDALVIVPNGTAAANIVEFTPPPAPAGAPG